VHPREWPATGKVNTMSCCTLSGEKVIVEAPPEGRGRFVSRCLGEWAGTNHDRLSGLACVVLHENGWTTREIGNVLGRHNGTVTRMIRETRETLRRRFADEVTSGEFAEPTAA
jgi:hypothetical protein